MALRLSVVLPIFNEEGNLARLIGEIVAAIPELWHPYEILCVDDASTDGSVAELVALQETVAAVRILRHRLNCGQSAAVASGFAEALAGVVITLDSDGQNDPADIPKYLAALGPEVDCVCGIRARRIDSAVKRLSSKAANRFRRWLLKDSITDAGCGFRAVRRETLAEVPVFNGMHRFLPIVMRAQGKRVTEIEINHRPRTVGVSKYGVGNRLWRGLRDCLGIRWYMSRSFPTRRLRDD